MDCASRPRNASLHPPHMTTRCQVVRADVPHANEQSSTSRPKGHFEPLVETALPSAVDSSLILAPGLHRNCRRKHLALANKSWGSSQSVCVCVSV
ncbi:unnamed protein product [Protopolystoma xenopodis]|uniref:Uncharacterized protein n=1 Tax=Protopolystoma xenopodis TaxID=117903 RepID=A0A448WNM7_9PLAT|nr:unnamed protein product [Protopolystoma xenopodis]